jgi:hypothetical protein
MMENDMNKMMISIFTLMLVSGAASTESLAKRHKPMGFFKAEMNALSSVAIDGRRTILVTRDQHRLDEKNNINGSNT